MEEDEISYQYKIYILSQKKKLIEEKKENIFISGKTNQKKKERIYTKHIFQYSFLKKSFITKFRKWIY